MMEAEAWIDEFARHLDLEHHAKLPDAVRQCLDVAEDWKLTLREVLPGATCSLCFSGVDLSEREVVLRLPLAEEERTTGRLAMRAFSGHGGVTILREDARTGATLMPRLRPGTNLNESGLTEDEQIEVAASLYLRIHQAEPADCWTHERWFQELWNFELPAGSPIDPALIRHSKRLIPWLLQSSDRTLLHGDLHHFNILQWDAGEGLQTPDTTDCKSGPRWVAVDPKGVIGDPAFEPVAFLRNPLPALARDADLVNRQRHRIERFAALMRLPIERIWAWAVAQIALDAAWSDGDWSRDWNVVVEATLAARPPEAASF